MIPSRDLAARFEAYADWRRRLSAGISSLHEWLSQQDLADAHFRLAKTYVALEDRAKGREHLLYALEIAPSFREAQQLLLEIVR